MSQCADTSGATSGDCASRSIRSAVSLPRFFLLIVFLTASVTAVNAQDAKVKCLPTARVDDVKETIHGTVVSDPYRWLEDQNSPETRAWIDAENACTQSVLRTLPGQDAIAKKLGELIKVDTINLPTERGGRYFYSRRAAGADLFVLYMRRGAAGAEEVLVDPATMSADHTTSVTFEGLSDDGKLVAYGVRKGGEDEVAIHFLDSDTRKELPDALPRDRYLSGVSFKADKSGLYYSKLIADGPRAYYHAMGADAAQDAKIFGDGYGSDKILATSVSEDGRYLLLTVFYGSACDKSEVYFQDLKTGGPIVPVVTTVDGCFQGDIAGDALYLQTNWKAPKWRILAVPLANPLAGSLEGSCSGRRITHRGFSPRGRENRGAVLAQRCFGDENISNLEGEAAGAIDVAAVGHRGRNHWPLERQRSFCVVSIVRDAGDDSTSTILHARTGIWAKPNCAD